MDVRKQRILSGSNQVSHGEEVFLVTKLKNCPVLGIAPRCGVLPSIREGLIRMEVLNHSVANNQLHVGVA